MKIKNLISVLALSCLFSCANNQSKQDENSNQTEINKSGIPDFRNSVPKLIDIQSNIWKYNFRIELQLPKGYFFSKDKILNEDSIEIGRINFECEELKSNLNGKDLIELYKKGGDFETEVTTYIYEHSYDWLIKGDSVYVNGRNWYFVIYKIKSKEKTKKDENSFEFCNLDNNRITSIAFYNKNLKDFDISKYVKILSTVSYKN